jgi:hypothetical protein
MDFSPEQIEAIMQYPIAMIVLVFIFMVIRGYNSIIVALLEIIKKQSKKE